MIPHGHEHRFVPFRSTVRGDGTRQVDLRCVCHQDRQGVPSAVVEQRLIVDPAGTVVEAAVRFGGLWFNALDVVRLAGAGLEECPTCNGDGPAVRGLGPCSYCGGSGVTGPGGKPLSAPELTRA